MPGMLTILGWLSCVALLLLLAAILRIWWVEFTELPIKWPRTRQGWSRLFWLFLQRCPVHHSALHWDPWNPGDSTLYCFECDGVSMWPGDIVLALRRNHKAEAKEA